MGGRQEWIVLKFHWKTRSNNVVSAMWRVTWLWGGSLGRTSRDDRAAAYILWVSQWRIFLQTCMQCCKVGCLCQCFSAPRRTEDVARVAALGCLSELGHCGICNVSTGVIYALLISFQYGNLFIQPVWVLQSIFCCIYSVVNTKKESPLPALFPVHVLFVFILSRFSWLGCCHLSHTRLFFLSLFCLDPLDCGLTVIYIHTLKKGWGR